MRCEHVIDFENRETVESKPISSRDRQTGLEKILSKTYRTDELWVKDFHLDKNIDNQQKQDYFNVIP